MRRAIAALAAFLIAVDPLIALAAPTGKLLMVEPAPSSSIDQAIYHSHLRFHRINRAVLERLGVNYKTIDARNMKVVWGKTGVVGWDWGKYAAGDASDAATESFNAVLWSGGMRAGVAHGGYATGSARQDSLLNSGYASSSAFSVPNLFLMDDYHVQQGTGQTMQATCCTTGANTMLSEDLYIYGLQRPVGSLNGWLTGGLFQRTMTRKTGTTAAGGYRPMLVANQPALFVNHAGINNAEQNNANCGHCDSIPGADNASTGQDSVIMFSLPFSNISGSKPLFLAYADGNGQPSGDSLANIDGLPVPAEIDPTVILYALAALDSSAGGALFDKDKLPIKLGLVIEAAGVYGTNRAGPGIPPQDSLNLIATIDSLSALNARGGVKLFPTVAINVAGVSGAGDSLNGTGAYNKAWINRWRSIGGTKFTPQSWAGVLTTNYRRANAGVGDVFGFADSRAFVGDGDQATGTVDTSMAQQMKWAKRLLREAGVDANEMSKTVVAPLLDWAPVNKQGATDRDSAFYAMRLAGYTTVISDANLPQSWPGVWGGTKTESATYRGVSNGLMGYTATEGVYTDVNGQPFKVLASNGHDIVGGTMQNVVNDSTMGPSTTFFSPIMTTMWRTVAGLLTPSDHWNTDVFCSGTDFSTVAGQEYYGYHMDQLVPHTLIYQNASIDASSRFSPRKGSILRLTAADLSGCTGCPRGAPARNGWWVVKSITNWMNAVNNAAGRTVICWDYPENINPTP